MNTKPISIASIFLFPLLSIGMEWERLADLDPPIRSLAIIEDKMIGLTINGVIVKSFDQGLNWVQSKALNISKSPFASLAISGSVVYAPGKGSVLYSEDFGETFHQNTHDRLGEIGPIFTIGDSILCGNSANGIWVSLDYGQNWRPTGSWQSTVTSIAGNHNILYMGTQNGGILQSSRNNGLSWRAKFQTPGLYDPIEGYPDIFSLHFSDGILIAGSRKGVVYISVDDANSFTRKSVVAGDVVITSIKKIGSTIYCSSNTAGVFKSTDNGNTWGAVNDGLGSLSVFALETYQNRIYALCSSGLYFFQEDENSVTEVPSATLNIRTALELEYETVPGFFYQLQGSSNLKSWFNMNEPILGNGESVNILKSTKNSRFTYFRVVVSH